MKDVEGILKEDVKAVKYDLIKRQDGLFDAKTLYKTIKAGTKVTVTLYETQNYCLGMPYYDIIDEDRYFCKVNIDIVDLNVL